MNRFFKRRVLVFFLAGLLVFMPLAANAGITDIITLLTTITSTLQNAIGTVLSGIQSIRTTITQFEQQLIWPVTLINETKNEVAQVRSQFSTLTGQIANLSTSSATLINPKQLEGLLRSGRAANLAQMNVTYTQVFQTLPPADQAMVAQRNLIDVDDALSLGALKTATVSDQGTQQMLSVADSLEQEAAASAPGSAPIVTAQAATANLQSQAMMQRLLAAELRQEAARLAHDNALRKQSADANRSLRNNLQQVLSR